MSNEFDKYFERKMKTLFIRFDVDKNERIGKIDLDQLLKKLSEKGSYDKWYLNHVLTKLWKTYFSIDSEDTESFIEFPEFLNQMKQKILCDNIDASELIVKSVSLIFNLIDVNSDEFVSFSELTSYFNSLEINDNNKISDIFDLMDTDYDGMITKEDFINFGTDFFIGKKVNAPSRMFFGPLI